MWPITLDLQISLWIGKFLIETFQFIGSPDLYMEMYESDQPAVRILKSKSAKGAKEKVDGAQGAEGS